jgi:hypothetical protein
MPSGTMWRIFISPTRQFGAPKVRQHFRSPGQSLRLTDFAKGT